jgi:hypothetical protein
MQSNTATGGGGGAIDLSGGSLISNRRRYAIQRGRRQRRRHSAHRRRAGKRGRSTQAPPRIGPTPPGLTGGGIYDSSGLTLTLSAPTTRTLKLNTNTALAGNGGAILFPPMVPWLMVWVSYSSAPTKPSWAARLYLESGARLRLDDTPLDLPTSRSTRPLVRVA